MGWSVSAAEKKADQRHGCRVKLKMSVKQGHRTEERCSFRNAARKVKRQLSSCMGGNGRL